MKNDVTIGLIQMSMSEDKEKNVEKAIKMVKEAAKKGANIVCLPELFISPYFPQKKDSDASKYAEKIPGPTISALSAAAKENGIVIEGGSIFEQEGDKFYNTTVILNEDGKILGKYRKMHIPQDPNFYEQNYFEPGNLGYKVFETRYGKLGTLICYDQWFPEAARINALMGADIIFYPTAIARIEGVEQTEGNWQEAWENVQRGHAIANASIVAAVNRVGRENKSVFWGGSFVYDQFGKLIAHGSDKEEVIIAKCNPRLKESVREGWRFFKERRPETYKKIIE